MGRTIQGDIEETLMGDVEETLMEKIPSWAILMEEALTRLDNAQLEVKLARQDLRRVQKDRKWTIPKRS